MADLIEDNETVEHIEQKLIRLEMELNAYYCEAGKTILEKAEQHERKINSLVDTIIETRRQLADVQKVKYCPDCDEHNEPSNNYCKRCGQKLISKNETEGV